MAEARWVNLVAAAACAIGAVNWAIWVGPGFGLHVNEFGFLRFNLAVWPALAGIVMAIKFLGRAVGTPRLALAAILLLPLPATAAPGTMPCGEFKTISAALRDTAGEEPVTEGLGADGKLWVTFAAEDGATWSLVSVDAQGKACMVMIGRGFGLSAKKAEGEPA